MYWKNLHNFNLDSFTLDSILTLTNHISPLHF